jgi:hypothetical protein
MDNDGALYMDQLWDAVFALAERQSAMPVQSLWVVKLSDIATLALNGTKQTVTYDDLDLAPFHIAIWYNGWLALLGTPMEATIMGGTREHLGTLIDAINNAR